MGNFFENSFNAISAFFNKDRDFTSNDLNEFDKDALSRLPQKDRNLLLSMFKEQEREYNLRSFHDESDALITSLAGLVLAIGLSVTFSNFSIPNPLFLATAVFALYFSIVSLFRTGRIKTILMTLTFLVTAMIVVFLIEFHIDINRINNGLSLIALGVSLIVIPRQKLKERSQLKLNKMKNDTILEQDKLIKEQSEIIDDLKKVTEISSELSKEIKLLKKQAETFKEELKVNS